MLQNCAIIDDFLEPGEHLRLWQAFQRTDPANILDWNRTYRAVNATLQDDTPADRPGPPELRTLSEKLFALTTGNPPLAVDPWTGFTQSPWTYPSGTGLEWHSDTGWLAAYIYYMHPAWKASWGGELLVAAGRDPCETDGTFVYPRPNRLVLLRGGVPHCIKKVENTAAVRASVSGFFFASGAAD